ncbi:hypothetical protein GLOTRDRAFT_101998 [Gloeophyllum trabeum ATCC 11539]|uniref:Mediator complex subunit 11 n=1 Tax=Gloeophyllum trabeum (strain ATCC 11539 / FP-39264 / Madison 617) TaxID=670483 RepID=S7QK78_GLOTA|nr:uncharacterized protein GLOTRDRAFT_101998 [Gloeophyllum trabeum ATCC 11539]EPQ60151.1 hypothetical protein GLOTRDRAFT_101998 [Gloeophyllum trabeum ATCC 11539]
MAAVTNGKPEQATSEIDPVWLSSRTARQIYALGEVEKTDKPEDHMPQGEERSEQFVVEVSEYFERLDAIHMAIRSSLAHIRQARFAPSTINAPDPGFVPPPLGVGMRGADASDHDPTRTRGFQEERVERDAWKGILDALTRIKQARDEDRRKKDDEMQV